MATSDARYSLTTSVSYGGYGRVWKGVWQDEAT